MLGRWRPEVWRAGPCGRPAPLAAPRWSPGEPRERPRVPRPGRPRFMWLQLVWCVTQDFKGPLARQSLSLRFPPDLSQRQVLRQGVNRTHTCAHVHTHTPNGARGRSPGLRWARVVPAWVLLRGPGPPPPRPARPSWACAAHRPGPATQRPGLRPPCNCAQPGTRSLASWPRCSPGLRAWPHPLTATCRAASWGPAPRRAPQGGRRPAKHGSVAVTAATWRDSGRSAVGPTPTTPLPPSPVPPLPTRSVLRVRPRPTPPGTVAALAGAHEHARPLHSGKEALRRQEGAAGTHAASTAGHVGPPGLGRVTKGQPRPDCRRTGRRPRLGENGPSSAVSGSSSFRLPLSGTARDGKPGQKAKRGPQNGLQAAGALGSADGSAASWPGRAPVPGAAPCWPRRPRPVHRGPLIETRSPEDAREMLWERPGHQAG